MIGHCKHCFQEFEQNKRGTKVYCSNACKTAASRAKRPVERNDDYRTATEKAVETKREKELRTKTCPQCGHYVVRNALQGNKRFCNAACKMAYHRRYDYEGRYTKEAAPKVARGNATPVPVINDPMDALRAALSEIAGG